MKFMHGLCSEIAKQIDSGKEGPKSYTDVVQRAVRNDGWDKQEDKSFETRSVRPSDGKEMKRDYGMEDNHRSDLGA